MGGLPVPPRNVLDILYWPAKWIEISFGEAGHTVCGGSIADYSGGNSL